jgi:hypothetical protein
MAAQVELTQDERNAQKSYWLEHSSQPTVEAMMLDSKAAEIDQLERPEVRLLQQSLLLTHAVQSLPMKHPRAARCKRCKSRSGHLDSCNILQASGCCSCAIQMGIRSSTVHLPNCRSLQWLAAASPVPLFRTSATLVYDHVSRTLVNLVHNSDVLLSLLAQKAVAVCNYTAGPERAVALFSPHTNT